MKMGAMPFLIFSHKIHTEIKSLYASLSINWKGRKLLYVCTGHSGIHAYSEQIFAHIDQSAVFGKRTPFHKDGEYNLFEKK